MNIQKTEDKIKFYLDNSKNPIILCSFGKDSLVLLHLIMKFKRIPIILFKEPFQQSKYSFAQRMIEKFNLDVYDYPPTKVDYFQDEERLDVIDIYNVGLNSTFTKYVGIEKRNGNDFLCVIKDFLNRPKISGIEFKWDCVFHGHKQCDSYGILKNIKVPDYNIFNGGIICMPLKDWTDDDIWKYIKDNGIEYNKDRYEKKEYSQNDDIFYTCYDCLDYNNIGKKVICPKLQKEVNCLAKSKEDSNNLKNYLLNTIY